MKLTTKILAEAMFISPDGSVNDGDISDTKDLFDTIWIAGGERVMDEFIQDAFAESGGREEMQEAIVFRRYMDYLLRASMDYIYEEDFNEREEELEHYTIEAMRSKIRAVLSSEQFFDDEIQRSGGHKEDFIGFDNN